MLSRRQPNAKRWDRAGRLQWTACEYEGTGIRLCPRRDVYNCSLDKETVFLYLKHLAHELMQLNLLIENTEVNVEASNYV